MWKNKKIIWLFLIILLSGCTANYNLEISEDGFIENVDIYSSDDEELLEYFIPAFSDVISYEDVDANFLEKVDGVDYYNNHFKKEKGNVFYNYNYKFTENNIFNSNILNFSYGTVIIRKYDHDEDGKDDYMLFTTGEDFMLFDRLDKLDKVYINIKCNYKVISSNADEVNENVYTWYLTPDNVSSINMVYNPDEVVDYRTFWEKIKDGEYFSAFILSVVIFVIGGFGYLILKKKGELRDRV